jgi:hypothetical protein
VLDDGGAGIISELSGAVKARAPYFSPVSLQQIPAADRCKLSEVLVSSESAGTIV